MRYKRKESEDDTKYFICINAIMGAFLVEQWLGTRLPMQGTRVRALVWEDPTCHRATKPVRHNYWAWASGACAPQRERPRQWEARAPRWRVAPARRNWRKPSHRKEDPKQPKINKYINKFIFFKKFKKIAIMELPGGVGLWIFFFKGFSYLFIYLFIFGCVGSSVRARAFSSCGKRGPLFIVVRGPLTIAASLVAEHRLQTLRLSSCGARA